jgi:hypothetical protein
MLRHTKMPRNSAKSRYARYRIGRGLKRPASGDFEDGSGEPGPFLGKLLDDTGQPDTVNATCNMLVNSHTLQDAARPKKTAQRLGMG